MDKGTAIRRCFGLVENQAAISWKKAALVDVDNVALHLIMTYVLQPQIVDTICSAARCFEATVKHPASWHGVRIDTSGFRPCGLAAHGL